jgi:hypothetical protein
MPSALSSRSCCSAPAGRDRRHLTHLGCRCSPLEARADAVPRGEWRWDDHGGLPSAKGGNSIAELWPHPVYRPWGGPVKVHETGREDPRLGDFPPFRKGGFGNYFAAGDTFGSPGPCRGLAASEMIPRSGRAG